MHLTRFDDVLATLNAVELQLPGGAGARLAHCAQSIECAVNGFPSMRAWPIRAFIGPLVLKKFLRQGYMSHDVGAGIPGVSEVAPALSTADGIARLKAAIALFRNHPGAFAPHFAYGPVARENYEIVQSMHVAEHLTALLNTPARSAK